MKKATGRIIAAVSAVSMMLSQAVTASAYSQIPMYQWTDSPKLLTETTAFVSDVENPLEGFIANTPYISAYFFKTDMENVTAEALGLPEDTEISRPSKGSFYDMESSYIYTDDSYYMIKGYRLDEAWSSILTENTEIDAVAAETMNPFTTQGTLGVYFTTDYEAELTPEDFPDMMVASVDNHSYDAESGTQYHYVFLSAEAFENGVDYNVLYDYIADNTDITPVETRRLVYNHCVEYEGEMQYYTNEIAPHRYAYTMHKGSIFAAEDVDSDLTISISDATITLQRYAENAVSATPEYHAQYDVYVDGKADISDATEILFAYTEAAAGLN